MPENKYLVRRKGQSLASIDAVEIEIMEGKFLKCVSSSVFDPKLNQYKDTGTIFPLTDVERIDFEEYIDPADEEEEEEEEEDLDDGAPVMSRED